MAAFPTARRCKLWASRRSTAKVSLGRRFEIIARAYVRRSGLTIRAVNWRLPLGEIDILAEGTRGLVVVEVRGRSRSGWRPVEALSGAKRRRLGRMARWLEAKHQRVVGVVLVEIVGRPPPWPAWLICRWPSFFGLEIRDYAL